MHARIDVAGAMIDRSQDSLMKLPDVMRRTTLSRTTIYRRIAAGTFPPPIATGANSVAWYASDVGEWIANPLEWQAAA